MEKADGFVRVPVLDAEACSHDADDVGRDRNRDAGEGEDNAAGGAAFEEIAVKDGEGEEAHQRADAAAGLGDFELHDRELDDVALLKGGDAEHGEDITGDARGQELEREGDLVEENFGEGNGKQKNEQGKAQLAEHALAEEGPDEARHEEDEGDAGGEEVHTVDTQNKDGDGEDDESDSCPGGANGGGTDGFALVPDEKEREEGDEEAVGVVGDGVPVVDQFCGDPIVDGGQKEGDDRPWEPFEDFSGRFAHGSGSADRNVLGLFRRVAGAGHRGLGADGHS